MDVEVLRPHRSPVEVWESELLRVRVRGSEKEEKGNRQAGP